MVCAAQRSQMKTRAVNILRGPATNFATSESRRPQKEQRIVLRAMWAVLRACSMIFADPAGRKRPEKHGPEDKCIGPRVDDEPLHTSSVCASRSRQSIDHLLDLLAIGHVGVSSKYLAVPSQRIVKVLVIVQTQRNVVGGGCISWVHFGRLLKRSLRFWPLLQFKVGRPKLEMHFGVLPIRHAQSRLGFTGCFSGTPKEVQGSRQLMMCPGIRGVELNCLFRV